MKGFLKKAGQPGNVSKLKHFINELEEKLDMCKKKFKSAKADHNYSFDDSTNRGKGGKSETNLNMVEETFGFDSENNGNGDREGTGT